MAAVPEHHFPTEVLEIRVLHPSLAQRLVGEVVHMLENEQPGHQPRRQRRLPGSHPTHRAEASRQKVPIDLPASRTSGWRRLMISSSGGRNRSSWRSSRGWLIGLPRQRISPSKESRTAHIGNPKPQENPHAHPAFLQNRLLAQIKSSRSINRFRILHGRLVDCIKRGADTPWDKP